MTKSFFLLLLLIGGSSLWTATFAQSPAPHSWTGRVSDRQCGRNINADCNRKCLQNGIPPVLVVDGTGDILSLTNPEALKPYPGEHVEVTGSLAGTLLSVESVKVLAENTPANNPADLYPGIYQVSSDHVIGIDKFVSDDGTQALLFSDYQTGLVRRLFPASAGEFAVGPGFAVASPVKLKVRFAQDKNGDISALEANANDGTQITARRIPLSEKEVRFAGAGASLAGTLITPESTGSHPAIILLHGSGPLTRYSFGPYPHFFASLGFAVLIYDKRGSGESTGEFMSQESYYPDPFTQDALAAVHFLQSQPGINLRAIGLWGSSEGGMLTTQVAARDPQIAFVINSSGFTQPLWQEMLYNRRAELRAEGFSPADVADAVSFQKLLFRVGRTGQGWAALQQTQQRVRTHKWFAKFFGTGVDSAETLRWRWQHVYRFDPLPALREVHCPVLGLFGGLDTSTPASVAVANMRKELTAAGNHDVTLKIFSRANHSLTEAQTGSDEEVPRLRRQVPGLFPTLRSWLLQRVDSSGQSGSL